MPFAEEPTPAEHDVCRKHSKQANRILATAAAGMILSGLAGMKVYDSAREIAQYSQNPAVSQEAVTSYENVQDRLANLNSLRQRGVGYFAELGKSGIYFPTSDFNPKEIVTRDLDKRIANTQADIQELESQNKLVAQSYKVLKNRTEMVRGAGLFTILAGITGSLLLGLRALGRNTSKREWALTALRSN